MELRLLRYLAEREGRIVSQDELLSEVWGYSTQARSRTVRTTVSRIRQRIEPDSKKPRHLLTVLGEGYRLQPAEGKRLQQELGLKGRERDLLDLQAALRAHPMVLIVGPGGVGKTAVARVLAAESTGSLWIDGRAASCAQDLEAEAAAALELPADSRLIEVLARQSLVVVDNLEGIEGAGELLERWRERVPSMLLTSRVRLGISEAVYELAPLSEAAMEALLLRAWGRTSLEGSVDVRPLLPALAGLPLAVELAAAWAPLLSPAQLAGRLADQALQDPARQDRHGSLEAVLDQSLALLREEDRQALVALAVCPGGLDLGMAEELIDGALPCLLNLRRHSLVQRQVSVLGQRLELLVPVRDHALRRHPERATAARAHHARLLSRRAEAVVAQLQTADDGQAWKWLAVERANLRAALNQPGLADGQRLALLQALDAVGTGLGPRTLHRGDLEGGASLREGRDWWHFARTRAARLAGDYEQAIAHGEQALADQQGQGWTSPVCDEISRAYVLLGQAQSAEPWSERALAEAKGTQQTANALRGLGKVLRILGRGEEALSHLRRAREVGLRGPRRLLAGITGDLAEHSAQWDAEEGLALIDEAVLLQEELGLRRDLAISLLRRGSLLMTIRGQGRADILAAKELADATGELRGSLHARWRLGAFAMELGEAEGEALLNEAARMAEAQGDRLMGAVLLLNRGHLRCDQGRPGPAMEDYREALRVLTELQLGLYLGQGYFMAGSGAAVCGEWDLALQWLEQGLLLWKELPGGRGEIEALLALMRGDPALLPESASHADWVRWSMTGGDQPEDPLLERSWTARQIARGCFTPKG
jgi:tetratricopeptide (TPR) repeat protein